MIRRFTGGHVNATGSCRLLLYLLVTLPQAFQAGSLQLVLCLQDLHVSEYVLSNELVSRALAMASESPMVKDILAELFVAEGNELYIEPANQYIRYQISSQLGPPTTL